MSKFAWVTLATNDSYSLGALVLAHSLKRVSTAHQLAILITTGVSESMRAKLKDIFNVVQEVNVLDSQDATNLALLARPELGVTFTKLHCWRLIQFEKCVFLDADTLVLQNCDELFEREEFSAAPDVGWPDCFNSGVFVYRPSVDTFTKITEYALQKGSFDGGDQGLLNSYFSDWAHKDISKHLPFLYNTCSTATYSYLPAFKQFADRIKILHFIGQLKPWLLNFNSQNRTVCTPQEYGHLSGFLQLWWNIFCDNVHPNLSDQMAGLAGALAKVKLGEARSAEQEAYEQHIRRQCWESGNVDYVGQDSFDNIWRKITQTLESGTKKDESSSQQSGKRFTSADIQDGKVEYDAETNSTITYKKIKGGYEMHIETPQPNGTRKFQTKTFYDPKPVSTEELEEETSSKKTTKRTDTTMAKNANVTVVTKKIPGGREEITTTVNPDGTSSIRTKTFYDEEEVEEESETTETEQTTPGRKVTTITTKQPQQQQQPQQRRTSLKKTNSEENTSQEYNVKSQRIEESRRVTETHEVSGKSTKSTRKNSLEQQQQLQQQNFQALTDNTQKKVKKNRFNQDDKVNIVSMKCPGGTEFRAATTVKKAEKKESTSRTVFEQTTTELTEKEIKIYEKQKKEAQKIKHITETTEIPCKHGTKQVIPSENPGDVTTLETRKVKGGTEFITTIVRPDGTVKKSTRTVFDPVPVEGDEDEQEIIEEFEEEIIEPGEPIVTTITKTVPRDVAEAKKKLGQDVPAFNDDGEFIENFPPKKKGGRK